MKYSLGTDKVCLYVLFFGMGMYMHTFSQIISDTIYICKQFCPGRFGFAQTQLCVKKETLEFIQ